MAGSCRSVERVFWILVLICVKVTLVRSLAPEEEAALLGALGSVPKLPPHHLLNAFNSI